MQRRICFLGSQGVRLFPLPLRASCPTDGARIHIGTAMMTAVAVAGAMQAAAVTLGGTIGLLATTTAVAVRGGMILIGGIADMGGKGELCPQLRPRSRPQLRCLGLLHLSLSRPQLRFQAHSQLLQTRSLLSQPQLRIPPPPEFVFSTWAISLHRASTVGITSSTMQRSFSRPPRNRM